MRIVADRPDVVGPWVYREIGKLWINDPGFGTALGWVNNQGELVAGVTFTNYDGANVWIDAAAKAKTRWADRRALWAVFSYCFDQLGCVRVSSMVPEDNKVAQKFTNPRVSSTRRPFSEPRLTTGTCASIACSERTVSGSASNFAS